MHIKITQLQVHNILSFVAQWRGKVNEIYQTEIQIKLRNLINEADPQFKITSLTWYSAFNIINQNEKYNSATFVTALVSMVLQLQWIQI
jgi:hypothetical protein